MIDFKLYSITDRHLCPDENLTPVVETLCASEIGCMQLREKDLPKDRLRDWAKRLYSICKRHGTKLFINSYADICAELSLDGVHLPEQHESLKNIRALIGDALVGVSTHSLEQAQQAEDEGADFITFGPVFFTPSKAAYGEPQGIKRLDEVTKQVSLPVFAIGGINTDNAALCTNAGAHGVAAISSLFSSLHIAETCETYREVLNGL